MIDLRTPKGKKRVRLEKPPYVSSLTEEQKKKLAVNGKKIQKKRIAKAPRDAKGKIIPNYRYKNILDSYKEHGIASKTTDGETKKHLFGNGNSYPLFVRKPIVADNMIKLIREGYPYTTVCRYYGVNRKTFLKWLEIGSQGIDKNYTKFFKRVSRAEARYEMARLEAIRKHEKTDWRAPAWILERRYPEHWGKRDANKAHIALTNTTINVNKKDELGKAVLRDEHAKELARKLIDGGEFGYTEIKEVEDVSMEDA